MRLKSRGVFIKGENYFGKRLLLESGGGGSFAKCFMKM